MIYTDISFYQNKPNETTYLPIDWRRMRDQGAIGTYIKASQGLWPDRQFIRNWQDSSNFIDHGAYHFFDASIDPIKQAEFFIGMIRTAEEKVAAGMLYPNLEPMLDIEWYADLGAAKKPNPANYLEKITTFLRRMEQDRYYDMLIYSNYSHVLTFLPMPSARYQPARYDLWASLGKYRLWLAQYHSQKVITLSGPNVPRPWVDWAIWQCSADGNGLGPAYGVHSASIDLNRENLQF